MKWYEILLLAIVAIVILYILYRILKFGEDLKTAITSPITAITTIGETLGKTTEFVVTQAKKPFQERISVSVTGIKTVRATFEERYGFQPSKEAWSVLGRWL